MVSVEKLKSGLSRYCDSELLPKLPAAKAIIVGTVLALYLNKIDSIINKIPEYLDVRTGNDIDIDLVRDTVKAQMKSDVSVDIPFIGTMTIDKDEIDKIYRYVMSYG